MAPADPPSPADAWSRVRALHERAHDLPKPEREAFVRAEAGADAALAAEVLRLLAHGEPDSDFLATPVASADAARDVEPLTPGERVGAYRIVRRIGAGGMGSVWLAGQERPARAVALKVLRCRFVSPQALQRFELEAEVLGRLQHPGIAAIYEAGVHGTAAGELPYFAMEFVADARDLVAFARERGLDVRARLRLLRDVCAAVHHGHQKGVIHRDLKPGNVLVDAHGRVKVIDYGVARVSEPELRRGLETRAGTFGTLPYMSPEQLRGGADGLDVRTDVYALGVLLYELLTGRTPHDVAELPLAEAVRAICEAPPSPPSQLARGVPRELDWIAARALEKDKERRYGSAAELGEDLERFLRDEPLVAGPPSAVYRLGKFYRRHRLPVLAASTALLALVGALVGTSIAFVRARRADEFAQLERRAAEREAARSREMLEFLGDSLAAADPARAGRELRMVEYLARAAEAVDRRFASEPATGAWLHGVIGRAFSGLGEHEPAEQHLSRSLALLQEGGQAGARELVSARLDLAALRTESGRFDDASALLEQSAAALTDALGDSSLHWRVEAARCCLALKRGKGEDVEAPLRAAIAGLERTLGHDDREVVGAMTVLAGRLQEQRRAEDAEATYADALQRALATLAPEDPLVLLIRNNLVMLRHARGDRKGAIEELAELLATRRRVLGEEHPDTVSTKSNLGALYFLEGRLDDAAPLFAEALAALESKLPPEHPTVLTLRINLGTCELRRHHPEAAEPHLREVHRARLATLGPDNERTLRAQQELANLERELAHGERATELYRDALERALRGLGAKHPLVAACEYELAQLLAAQGRQDEARTLLEGALAASEAGERSTERFSAADFRAALDKLR